MREPRIKSPDEVVEDFFNTVPNPIEIIDKGMKKFEKDTNRFQRDIEGFPDKVLKNVTSGAESTVDSITDAPKYIIKDTVSSIGNVVSRPGDVATTVTRTPANLVNNVPEILKTALTDSLDIQKGSYTDRATKMRTITDFIPFI